MGCGRVFNAPAQQNSSGPQLAAQALPPTVAPEGVSLIDVSGGSPPYAVDVRPQDNKSGGATADTASGVHPSDGGSHMYFQYRAGPNGGKTDIVTVTDSDGGLLGVQVTVGESLSISPELQQRAPLQTQSFAIRGGEAPYWVYIISTGNDCAGTTPDAGPLDQLTEPDCVVVDGGIGSCIDSSGNLTVRSCGGGTDVIQVFDQAGIKVEATVPVSEALKLQAVHLSTVPGGQLQLEAVGGVPPYNYGYAPRGDVSDGRVDVSGVFTAGPNANVTDELQVSDNVGASQTLKIDVQNPSIALPRQNTFTIFPGDFNGDGIKDVAAVSNEDGSSGAPTLVLATGSGAGFEGAHQFALPFGPTQVLVGDFNGDGTSDLLLTNASDGEQFGFQLVAGRRDGSMDFVPSSSIPNDQVFGQLVEYDFSNDVSYQSIAYALSLTALADGGVGELTAVTGDANGHMSIAAVMDVPQTGDGLNEQLITATDFQGYESVLLAFMPQAGSGCTSQQMEVVQLGFTTDDAGIGIARDPSSDVKYCVPVPDPSSSTLTPATFDTFIDSQDFVVLDSDTFDFPLSLAINDGNNNFHAVTFDGGGNYPDYGSSMPYRVAYMGSYNTGLVPELQILWPDVVDRWFFPSDGGPFSLRPDGLAGGYEDTATVDFDGDFRVDEFVIAADGGHLEFLRGGRDAHLATGHSRALASWNSTVIGSADLDQDGTGDVLINDDESVRIFWGDRNQPLAIGPTIDLGMQVWDFGSGKAGGWSVVEDYSTENALIRVQHLAADDGGLNVKDAATDFEYTFLSPVNLGPGYDDATLVHQFYDEPFQEGDTAPLDTSSALAVYAGGRTSFIGDPLLGLTAVTGAVNTGSSDGGSDLVLGFDDQLGNPGSIELHRFSPTDAGFWDPNALDAAQFSDSFLNPLTPTGIFPFASTAGGPIDRVLVAASPVDTDGICQNASPDTDEGADAALYLYSVSGGHLTLLASGEYQTIFDDVPFENFCDAQATWRVRAIPLAGTMTLLVQDQHWLYGDSIDQSPIKSLWLDSQGLEMGYVEVSSDTTDLAVGDFNGDGKPEMAGATFGSEFQFTVAHADGTLY